MSQLSEATRDLWVPKRVERLAIPPDSITFLRDYVARSIPVVVSGGMKNWRCMRCWSLPYLTEKCGDSLVSVNITPDGRADAVKKVPEVNGTRLFVKPHEQKMTMREFTEVIMGQRSDRLGIPYLSRQNDSLREEFKSVMDDVPLSIDFARDAFGNEPEAVNLWIGDDRSLSSCHKDHYENMYCVLRGTKRFTLFPPSVSMRT